MNTIFDPKIAGFVNGVTWGMTQVAMGALIEDPLTTASTLIISGYSMSIGAPFVAEFVPPPLRWGVAILLYATAGIYVYRAITFAW